MREPRVRWNFLFPAADAARIGSSFVLLGARTTERHRNPSPDTTGQASPLFSAICIGDGRLLLWSPKKWNKRVLWCHYIMSGF
jgi:hypothetical protein